MLFVFLSGPEVESVLMASTLGSTNGGTPFPGEPFTFPSFGNIGPPCIATLSLPGLTSGLPVWLFTTLVITNFPVIRMHLMLQM